MSRAFLSALGLMVLMSVMTAGGQVLLKGGMRGRTRPSGPLQMIRFTLHPQILAGLFLALTAPLVYIQALKLLGLSAVYGLNGLSYFFVYAFSRIFLDEKGSRLHLAALLLIAGGVAVWSI